MSQRLKEEILSILEKDREFRYAVAGLIGLDEILRRLDRHDEKFNEILATLKEHTSRFEEHDKKFNSILARLDEHDKKFNSILARLDEHDKKFNSILARLDEHDEKFNEILATLKEHTSRFEEHDKKFNSILARLDEHDKKFNSMIAEIRDIRAYMDRISLTLEEEAWEVLASKLRRRGLEVRLTRLILPDLEVNIYGVEGDLCVVGEVSTRVGIRMISSVDEKLTELRRRHPEYLREKVLKVIYTMWATEDAIEEARRRKVWLVKSLEDLTPLDI